MSKVFCFFFSKKKAFLLLALPAAAYLGSYRKRSKKLLSVGFGLSGNAQVGVAKALATAFRGRGLGEGAVPVETGWSRPAWAGELAMKTGVFTFVVLSLVASQAAAQISGVQVKDGDVYVQVPTGLRRLTHDGHVAEATLSRDQKLIAYIHNGPTGGEETINDIYLCSAPQQACVLAVRGITGPTTENNLAQINTVRFSLQAGEKADGTLAGSIFFLSEAGGANTDALHRVMLGGKTLQQVLHSAAPFVTYANSMEIVPGGKFAGALRIEVQQYTSHGACGAMTIFDPNTKKILQQGPADDC